MINKEKIDKKNQEIFFILKNNINNLSLGLFSGQTGILLFFYHYYKYTKKEEVFLAFQTCLNQLIEEIHSFDNVFFSNGLSGVAWFLNFLNRENVVSSEISDIIKDLDWFIEDNLDANYETSDFMHGALGLAFYFTQREKLVVVERIFQILFKNHEEGDELFWVSKMYDEDDNSNDVINLSLAHGSAAVIIILSKYLSKQVVLEKNHFYDKLARIIRFMQRIKQKESLDIYPGHCTFNNGKIENVYSRLSWCYGEMGIGLAFWQAGYLLKNSSYKKEAINIYRKTLERKLPQEIRIKDACICHGTAGIAHMYNRMYYNTKLPEFRKAASYWVEQTLKMAKFEDGVAGYKSWEDPNWIPKYNLLGGIAGVGLSFLSHLNEECASWDECMLLS